METLKNSEIDIILIACGGAGIEMTRYIDKTAYGIRRIVALDTDSRVYKNTSHCDGVFRVRKRDGGEFKSPDEIWETVNFKKIKIADLIGAHHLAIIVTGLGGSTGVSLPRMAAQCAREAGAVTLAFATLPLAGENNDATILAGISTSLLNEEVDNLLTYDHRIADRCLPANSQLDSIYELAIPGLRQYLWNTVGCLTHHGLIAMDFEEIRSVFCQQTNDAEREKFYFRPAAKLGWGCASGPDRAELAARAALRHPLLEAEGATSYYGVSVSIRAARSGLKLIEVSAIMKLIRNHYAPSTQIIFSANADDTMEERLQVGVILVPEINYLET